MLPSCWEGEVGIDVTPQENVSLSVRQKSEFQNDSYDNASFPQNSKKKIYKYACQYARKFQKGTYEFDSHFLWRMKAEGRKELGALTSHFRPFSALYIFYRIHRYATEVWMRSRSGVIHSATEISLSLVTQKVFQ